MRKEQQLALVGSSIQQLFTINKYLTECPCLNYHRNVGLQSDSEFLRAIMYSISLGGDTDTIASMAGAIAGTVPSTS